MLTSYWRTIGTDTVAASLSNTNIVDLLPVPCINVRPATFGKTEGLGFADRVPIITRYVTYVKYSRINDAYEFFKDVIYVIYAWRPENLAILLH